MARKALFIVFQAIIIRIIPASAWITALSLLTSRRSLTLSRGSSDTTMLLEQKEKVILVIGSFGMDRLLKVESYPQPDAKIRTTSYSEAGGGNGANTAAAMGFLAGSSFLREKNIRIKFLGKVGADLVGQQLIEELNDSGVDTSSQLFKIGDQGTTTGITTVIVSAKDSTRTCIHTPGTCGELTLEDVKAANMDELFENVVHFHSDSRHTSVSVYLAKEARSRGILVSCDSEKDRSTRDQDALVEICDILFTSSLSLCDYLRRLEREFEIENGRTQLSDPTVCVVGEPLKQESVDAYSQSLYATTFFVRCRQQTAKQVVVSL